MTDRLGGQRIEIGERSSNHINALNIEYADDSEGDPIRGKSASVLNMVEALIGGADGIDKPQRSLIDRAVTQLYREHHEKPDRPAPTLVDLTERLNRLGEPEAADAARALEIYAIDGMDTFAHPTNVDTANRLLVYDVSGLGAELKTLGLMVVLDQVWNRVVRNRALGRRTWLWVNEFHLLFSSPYAAETFLRIYKRARKWDCRPPASPRTPKSYWPIRPPGSCSPTATSCC